MESIMRTASIPVKTGTETPRVTTRDYAQFCGRLLNNEDGYRDALEAIEARHSRELLGREQSYGVMYEDEKKIAALLAADKVQFAREIADVTNEYANKELEIYAAELAERHGWLAEYGGSSQNAPDIVMLIHANRMLISRLTLVEQRVKALEARLARS
jgi:uncharacterized protein with von Willebrand factor type A (vWA) domain